MKENLIHSINGPVITVKNTKAFSMLEMVYVGNKKLIGEVISVNDAFTTIQVYEGTTGLMPGEPVYATGSPMCVTLGPGMLTGIFDGIQRPLSKIYEISGLYADEGVSINALDETREWDITLKVQVGDKVLGGQVYATCPETELIVHRLLVPPSLNGSITYTAPNGKYKLNDVIAKVQDKFGKEHELTLCQKWPIRQERPCGKRLPANTPLITGQRVIDSLFPIAKGGTAAVPGGFGTGKTVTQHQLAKWCDADIIVYIGCGAVSYTHLEASLHMVEEKAAAVRQQQQKQVEQATSECQRQYNVLMESLDQKYERNHKRWEEELYVRCML